MPSNPYEPPGYTFHVFCAQGFHILCYGNDACECRCHQKPMCIFFAKFARNPTDVHDKSYYAQMRELPDDVPLKLTYTTRGCRFRAGHDKNHEVYSPDDNGKIIVFPK